MVSLFMHVSCHYPRAQASRVIGRAKRDPPPNHLGLDFQILLASERCERDTLRSVQLRIADIYIYTVHPAC